MATARRKRRSFHEPGHAHELTFSRYHKFPFLKSDRTCHWLAKSINAARVALAFHLYAYVFMPDHVHLLLKPTRPNADVASILRAIKQPVAHRAVEHLQRHAPHWLDRIAQPRGTRTEHRFWQPGGGYDRNIINPKTLRAAIEYIP
jgi:putative transposase